MTRVKMYSVTFFMWCSILSTELCAMDSILGTTANQFAFKITDRHNAHELEKRLTFILDNYIPGEPQRVRVYHQRGNSGFALPESLADVLPELPEYYSIYYGTSVNNYRMAALLLLAYHAQLNNVTLNTATVTHHIATSGVHFTFTAQATPLRFQVEITTNSHEEKFLVEFQDGRQRVWGNQREYDVIPTTYASPTGRAKVPLGLLFQENQS